MPPKKRRPLTSNGNPQRTRSKDGKVSRSNTPSQERMRSGNKRSMAPPSSESSNTQSESGESESDDRPPSRSQRRRSSSSRSSSQAMFPAPADVCPSLAAMSQPSSFCPPGGIEVCPSIRSGVCSSSFAGSQAQSQMPSRVPSCSMGNQAQPAGSRQAPIIVCTPSQLMLARLIANGGSLPPNSNPSTNVATELLDSMLDACRGNDRRSTKQAKGSMRRSGMQERNMQQNTPCMPSQTLQNQEPPMGEQPMQSSQEMPCMPPQMMPRQEQNMPCMPPQTMPRQEQNMPCMPPQMMPRQGQSRQMMSLQEQPMEEQPMMSCAEPQDMQDMSSQMMSRQEQSMSCNPSQMMPRQEKNMPCMSPQTMPRQEQNMPCMSSQMMPRQGQSRQMMSMQEQPREEQPMMSCAEPQDMQDMSSQMMSRQEQPMSCHSSQMMPRQEQNMPCMSPQTMPRQEQNMPCMSPQTMPRQEQNMQMPMHGQPMQMMPIYGQPMQMIPMQGHPMQMMQGQSCRDMAMMQMQQQQQPPMQMQSCGRPNPQQISYQHENQASAMGLADILLQKVWERQHPTDQQMEPELDPNQMDNEEEDFPKEAYEHRPTPWPVLEIPGNQDAYDAPNEQGQGCMPNDQMDNCYSTSQPTLTTIVVPVGEDNQVTVDIRVRPGQQGSNNWTEQTPNNLCADPQSDQNWSSRKSPSKTMLQNMNQYPSAMPQGCQNYPGAQYPAITLTPPGQPHRLAPTMEQCEMPRNMPCERPSGILCDMHQKTMFQNQNISQNQGRQSSTMLCASESTCGPMPGQQYQGENNRNFGCDQPGMNRTSRMNQSRMPTYPMDQSQSDVTPSNSNHAVRFGSVRRIDSLEPAGASESQTLPQSQLFQVSVAKPHLQRSSVSESLIAPSSMLDSSVPEKPFFTRHVSHGQIPHVPIPATDTLQRGIKGLQITPDSAHTTEMGAGFLSKSQIPNVSRSESQKPDGSTSHLQILHSSMVFTKIPKNPIPKSEIQQASTDDSQTEDHLQPKLNLTSCKDSKEGESASPMSPTDPSKTVIDKEAKSQEDPVSCLQPSHSASLGAPLWQKFVSQAIKDKVAKMQNTSSQEHEIQRNSGSKSAIQKNSMAVPGQECNTLESSESDTPSHKKSQESKKQQQKSKSGPRLPSISQMQEEEASGATSQPPKTTKTGVRKRSVSKGPRT